MSGTKPTSTAPATIGETPAAAKPALAQLARQLVQELQYLKNTLDHQTIESPVDPDLESTIEYPLAPPPEQPTPTAQAPNQLGNQPAIAFANSAMSKSPRAYRRGAQEVQGLLFDEPNSVPSAATTSAPAQRKSRPAKTAASAVSPAQKQRLLDDLVQEYLPELEQRLRQELKRLLEP